MRNQPAMDGWFGVRDMSTGFSKVDNMVRTIQRDMKDGPGAVWFWPKRIGRKRNPFDYQSAFKNERVGCRQGF
jgi:hypothetical protein